MQDTDSGSVATAGAGPPEYRTLLELGRGGMGSAALACVTGMGGFERLVVIKRLRKELAGDERAVKRILAEARLAASIHHANVVATQHTGVDTQGPFLVLDYVEGASLEELLDASRKRGAPLPVPICLRVALDALSGLSAIHGARDSRGRSLDILHRDLSLQNVLVGRDGVARIADFGIAKSALASGMTEEGYLIGKLHYLSPEYLRREGVGPTMDVYALGVTLWLAVTGRSLWSGASDGQVMHAILTEGIPRASELVTLDPAVDELLAKACAAWPEMRFETARAMAEAIERIQRDTGAVATHREVAEHVEALVGGDLEQRRRLVAGMLEQRVVSGSSSAGFRAPRVDPAFESAVARSSGLPPPPKPRRVVLAASLGVTTLLAAALVMMSLRNAPDSSADAAASESARVTAVPPRASVEASPGIFPVPSALLTAEATAQAPVASVIPPKTSAPRRKVPTARAPQGARAPDDIKAKNPYRRSQP